MKQQAENFDIIEKYLNGLMSEEEVRRFEEGLRSDPELALEYGRHMEILESVRDKEQLEVRKKLKESWLDYSDKTRGKIGLFRQRRFYWIAASLLILMGISLVLIEFSEVNPLLNEKLGLFKDHSYSLSSECEELYAVKPRVHGFTLVYPADSATFYMGQPIKFQWETEPDRPVYLDILNRKGDMVISFKKMPDCEYEILSLEKRGIYLFRFRDGNEVMKLGVFFVR